MPADEFQWSDASAVWQVANGEAGTARTLSATGYLEDALSAGNAERCRWIALNLLTSLESERAGQS